MTRLMRSYAAQILYSAFGLVTTNFHLIRSMHEEVSPGDNGPEQPPQKRRLTDELDIEEKDLGWKGVEFLPPPSNAPPSVA